jgi:hypothetical protein
MTPSLGEISSFFLVFDSKFRWVFLHLWYLLAAQAWRGATTQHAISIMPPQSQIFLVACQSASVIPKAFLSGLALKMGDLRPLKGQKWRKFLMN